MVIVFEDGAKRNSWKMAVIEELIHRRDNKVRGANARVVTKGKTLCLSRPLQKLHPIEVRESSTDVPRSRERQGQCERTLQKRYSLPSCGARCDLENARNDEPAGRLVRLFLSHYLDSKLSQAWGECRK